MSFAEQFANQTTVQTTSIEQLADKTMFLSIEFNRFGNARQAEVDMTNTTAQAKRFSHTKKLLDSPELADIQKADNALRIWLDAPTRCWKYGKSIRMVPVELVDEIVVTCENYQNIPRPKLVKIFIDAYLSRVAEAQKELGDKFNPADYPSVEEVEKEFSFTFQFLSFSTPDKLKTISPALYNKEKAKAAQMLTVAVDDWKNGRRVILQEMVNHLLGILKPEEGTKKKLHAKTVEKLQEFLKTFDLDSVKSLDDPELQAEVAKLKMLMQGVDADKIKESDTLKAQLVENFSAASASLSSLVTTTGRKFR